MKTKDMKKKQTFLKSLLFAILFSAPLTASAQDVLINETNFPDENFRNWLLAQDYGADGVLTAEEIGGITALSIYYKGITSLKGIELFTALTRLDCSDNRLTALDVSGCTALTYLDCCNNQLLTTLNVSKNTALTYLSCYGNQLTALDVSNNTALEWLNCILNQLTMLDVSNNTALTELHCDGNQLTTLDVSGCTALTRLDCYGNQLTALDVSGCTALTELYCYDNQLTALDVSGCTKLWYLDCYNNQLTTLDVSGCTKLWYLECRNNQLTALDMSNNTVLTGLSCYRNQIKGVSMDALIASLPQQDQSWLYIYDDSEGNEGNVCTKTQVEAIKAKGWIPYYYDFTMWQWVEYEGSDDEETGIAQPATATTDANEPVYTLSGQKVSNGSLKGKKGVYIIGGKKVVVK